MNLKPINTMRKLLNTLYVTTPGAYLSKDGENIVIKVENQERFRIPVHNIEYRNVARRQKRNSTQYF